MEKIKKDSVEFELDDIINVNDNEYNTRVDYISKRDGNINEVSFIFLDKENEDDLISAEQILIHCNKKGIKTKKKNKTSTVSFREEYDNKDDVTNKQLLDKINALESEVTKLKLENKT